VPSAFSGGPYIAKTVVAGAVKNPGVVARSV
jgi:hypothetical protein